MEVSSLQQVLPPWQITQVPPLFSLAADDLWSNFWHDLCYFLDKSVNLHNRQPGSKQTQPFMTPHHYISSRNEKSKSCRHDSRIVTSLLCCIRGRHIQPSASATSSPKTTAACTSPPQSSPTTTALSTAPPAPHPSQLPQTGRIRRLGRLVLYPSPAQTTDQGRERFSST
jgi:hypothetical protein